ncbi:MAG: hypothetical protein GC151_17180 [Betaproteobacteria bacterium]|nr:hypothetical protein [Betaproteobacteria bacterium]
MHSRTYGGSGSPAVFRYTIHRAVAPVLLLLLLLVLPDVRAETVGRDAAGTVGEPSRPRVLTLASWNAEWLADARTLRRERFWSRCAALGWPNVRLRPDLPFCDVYRFAGLPDERSYIADKLVPVRESLKRLALERVDVIALQEVAGRDAVDAVLPTGYRVACVTTRDDAQNLAFAVRATSGFVTACREVASLSLEDAADVPHPVRRGLELTLGIAGHVLTILNVHLKAFCVGGSLDREANASCAMLQRQVVPLEAWVEAQGRARRPFVIVGDWNRDLEAEVRGRYRARRDGSDPASPPQPHATRNVFPELDDGEPEGGALRLAAVDRGVAVHGACFGVVDQLVVSRSLLAVLDADSLRAGLLPARLDLPRIGASDHCLLRTSLSFRPAADRP